MSDYFSVVLRGCRLMIRSYSVIGASLFYNGRERSEDSRPYSIKAIHNPDKIEREDYASRNLVQDTRADALKLY